MISRFSISYIAFLDLVFVCLFVCFCLFFNAGPMLIAVFITEMVILHKYVFIIIIIIIIITITVIMAAALFIKKRAIKKPILISFRLKKR